MLTKLKEYQKKNSAVLKSSIEHQQPLEPAKTLKIFRDAKWNWKLSSNEPSSITVP